MTPLIRIGLPALLALAGVSARAAGDVPSPPAAAASSAMTLPQSDYIEQCGGCHGIQGTSAPAAIPVLRERVGYFMCLPEGRSYLIRLPNVAHSRITDNAQLADLMNFVVFGLGKGSTPAKARPFAGDEVRRERQNAMNSVSLVKVRAGIVDKLIHKCGAPASLRYFYPGQKIANAP